MWINLRLQGFVFCTLQFRTDLIIFGKKLIDAVDHKVIVFVKGTDLILINGSADRHKDPFSRFGHRIAKMINSFGDGMCNWLGKYGSKEKQQYGHQQDGADYRQNCNIEGVIGNEGNDFPVRLRKTGLESHVCSGRKGNLGNSIFGKSGKRNNHIRRSLKQIFVGMIGICNNMVFRVY